MEVFFMLFFIPCSWWIVCWCKIFTISIETFETELHPSNFIYFPALFSCQKQSFLSENNLSSSHFDSWFLAQQQHIWSFWAEIVLKSVLWFCRSEMWKMLQHTYVWFAYNFQLSRLYLACWLFFLEIILWLFFFVLLTNPLISEVNFCSLPRMIDHFFFLPYSNSDLTKH